MKQNKAKQAKQTKTNKGILYGVGITENRNATNFNVKKDNVDFCVCVCRRCTDRCSIRFGSKRLGSSQLAPPEPRTNPTEPCEFMQLE